MQASNTCDFSLCTYHIYVPCDCCWLLLSSLLSIPPSLFLFQSLSLLLFLLFSLPCPPSLLSCQRRLSSSPEVMCSKKRDGQEPTIHLIKQESFVDPKALWVKSILFLLEATSGVCKGTNWRVSSPSLSFGGHRELGGRNWLAEVPLWD